MKGHRKYPFSLIFLKYPTLFTDFSEKVYIIPNGQQASQQVLGRALMGFQARRKHFGSGAAIGTKKTAGGLGPRGRSPRKLREFGHFKALKLALLQQFRQDFYYKNLKAERHILKD